MSEHDKGTPSGSSWPFDLLSGARAKGEAAQDAVGDLATELTSFTKFQKRVDQIVLDLKGSAAGPGRVGQDRMTRQQLGGGDGAFVEASDLFSSYEKVITELEKLSKVLSDSIEGMGIAVLASHKGYEQLDADVRERMAAIARKTEEHYGGEYIPTPEDEQSKPGGDGGTEQEPKQKPSGGGVEGRI
ncbi:hypothetical protein [Streptomyces pactum]|uniref:hypothetical protein n=1 Tax=Streptomyces pactum TaxID=68249 RepID=UPI0036FB62B5